MALASKLELVRMVNAICDANDKLNAKTKKVNAVIREESLEVIVNSLKLKATNMSYTSLM
jgi:hypothetical protein